MIATEFSMLPTRERSEGANKTLLLGPHWELLDHVRGVPLHRHCEDDGVPITLSQSLKFKLLPKGSIHSLHISHAEQLRSHFIKIVNKENRKPPKLKRCSQEEEEEEEIRAREGGGSPFDRIQLHAP
jgi:hypothetical protein